MSTLIFLVFVVIFILLTAMYFSPSFADLVVSKGGAAGAALAAFLAWIVSWWADVPVEMPPL